VLPIANRDTSGELHDFFVSGTDRSDAARNKLLSESRIGVNFMRAFPAHGNLNDKIAGLLRGVSE